jgi:quercetin dioxygenase-like cupin family protein
MRNLLPIVLLVAAAFCTVATGQSRAPAPILPDSIRWVSPPNISGLQAAWILGAEQKPGAYILRVKLAKGARIPPHTHPDERNTTVLAGTIYVGFGETFDEARVVAIPAGAVYVAPAKVPHYVWAKDGDTIYQEAGVGPTGTVFIMR